MRNQLLSLTVDNIQGSFQILHKSIDEISFDRKKGELM